MLKIHPVLREDRLECLVQVVKRANSHDLVSIAIRGVISEGEFLHASTHASSLNRNCEQLFLGSLTLDFFQLGVELLYLSCSSPLVSLSRSLAVDCLTEGLRVST